MNKKIMIIERYVYDRLVPYKPKLIQEKETVSGFTLVTTVVISNKEKNLSFSISRF